MSVIVAAIPFFINSRVSEGVPMLKRAADRQNAYIETLAMLRDVETGQRGFVLSGIDTFLEPYTAALLELPALKHELVNGAMDEPELAAAREINQLVEAKLVNAAETVAARRSNLAAPEDLYAAASVGKAQMDKLRILLGKQIALMAERRNKARGTLVSGSAQVAYFSALAAALNAVLLGIAAYSVSRLIKDRSTTATQLRHAVTAANTRNSLMTGAARMLQAIDSASTLSETSAILQTCLAGLMPKSSGTVYLYREAVDCLEHLASWGNDVASSSQIEARDCWALRFGRSHEHANDADLCCGHLVTAPVTHHICMPMVTQGAVIGMMSVQFDSATDGTFDLHKELASALTEQVSLALANVRLREALRAQSIIDPLTDLYNRRFLEETLTRELARSERTGTALSVIMLDVDHFKRLNDTFGHDAGDVVLKAIAHATRKAVRKADIVCRYGGEELIVVLPDCAEGMAIERAELIRQAIEGLQINHLEHNIPGVTASFGVASHPTFGLDGDALIRAADAALYVAKRRGRNNVQLAVELAQKAGTLRSVTG